MPKSTTIRIEHTDTIEGLASGVGRKQLARRIINALESFTSGTKRAKTLEVFPNNADALVQASGTLTLATSSGAVGGVINGVTITDTWATSDTVSAALVAAAINASTNALVQNIVTATSALGVVTVGAVQSGSLGNTITLAASGTNVTASVARLAGGTGGSAARTSVTF